MENMNALKKFAKRLRQLRKLNKMSQEKLAEKANLSLTYISNIERAEQNPTLTSLEKIAKAFNITLAELLSFPDDKKIMDANSEDINKVIELLKDAIDMAKRYKVTKNKF